MIAALLTSVVLVWSVLSFVESGQSGRPVSVKMTSTASAVGMVLPARAVKKDRSRVKAKQRKRLRQLRLEARQARQRGSVLEGHIDSTGFRVSSFNVLGHKHTTGKHSKKASGPQRTRWAFDLLKADGVSVVGLQEFQIQQYREFQRIAGSSWNTYPGDTLGTRITVHNSIAWRIDTWELESADTIDIPYFGGVPTKMPFIQLRHKPTGRLVWFANFHNPADTRGPAQHWRDAAKRLQVDLVNRLTNDGTPMILTGDMNERVGYFCSITSTSTMRSASGGSTGVPCLPPRGMGVDWIFGSVGLEFSNYISNRGGTIPKITDHPYVAATVSFQDLKSADGN